jgi:ankyrin repeat protein
MEGGALVHVRNIAGLNGLSYIVIFNTGANLVDEDYKGRQCAHLAAMRNHKKVLQFLFDLGVDLDCRCENGKTPVHYAAQYGGQYPNLKSYTSLHFKQTDINPLPAGNESD